MLLFCSIILYYGCSSPKNRLEDKIKEMQSRPFSIPYSKMSCWINDTLQLKQYWEQAKIKLVVYTDSTKCSECTLKNMYMWQDFVEMEQEFGNQFSIVFIFQTKAKTSARTLATLFKITELNHPMYIDNKSELVKNNSHLPSESIYHIFLLDENNNVILVGNPLFNSQIEEMLKKVLKQKFGSIVK